MDIPLEKKNGLRWGLVLVPPVLLLVLMIVFPGWNVVWGDDVSMCPLFDKWYRSTLTFGDLWEPYQGHRIVCHRVLELLIGRVTHWNVNAVLGTNYLLVALSFVLICSLVRDLSPVLAGRARLMLTVVCSCFMFSTCHAAIWNNGFNLGPVLSVTSVVCGVTCLAKFRASFPVLGICLLAGAVASCSFGNGLTYWVALTPLLYVRLRDDPHRLTKACLWVGTAGLVVGLYFYHLGGNGTPVTFGEAVLNVFRRPAAFLGYWFTCAGAGVFYLNGAKAALPAAARLLIACGAPACGLLGLTVFGWTAWKLWRPQQPQLLLIAPWLSLGFYAVSSVGAVALTRFSTSPLMSAITSHYIIFSQYMWLALAVCLTLLAPKVKRGWVPTLSGLLALCYLASYANGVRYLRNDSMELKRVRAELLSQPTSQTYRVINPDRDPAQVASYMEMLRLHRLAPFRETAP